MWLAQISLLPVVLILVWVIKRDRLPEPPRVVWMTVLLGVLATLPILVFEFGLSWFFKVPLDEITTISGALTTSFLIAAFVEEIFKFLVLWFYAARHDAFDEPFDGIVYGVAASLGFAALENVLYVFQGGAGIGVLRAFTAIPLHASCGVLMGACIGIAKFSEQRRPLWIATGVVGAIALHGTYNSFAFSSAVFATREQGGMALLCLLGLLVTIIFSVGTSMMAIARMRRDQELAVATPMSIDEVETVRVTIGDPEFGTLESSSAISISTSYSQGVPILPIVAMICSVLSAGLTLLLIIVGTIYADIEPQDISGVINLLTILCILIGGTLALAGVVTSIIALLKVVRWRAGSIAALVLSLFMLMILTLVIVLAVMESQGTT